MPATRRSASSLSGDGGLLGTEGKKGGNERGIRNMSDSSSSSSGRGLKRVNSGGGNKQSTLSFTSKKALPPTPDKKSKITAPNTITSLPSPPPTPAFARTLTPLSSRTTISDDQGRVKTPVKASSATDAIHEVPDAWKPLGEGEETAEMLANLKGEAEDAEEVEVDVEVEDESDVHSDDSGADPSPGVRARKAMLRAEVEIEAARKAGTGTSRRITSSKPADNKKVGLGAKLNTKDKKWEATYWETSKVMGGDECPPIHCTPKSHTRIHHILRVFDLTSDYGPCIGISRLQRWERAQEWGLNPPQEIRDILLTYDGAEDDSYRETVFHNNGIYVPDA